MAAKQRIIDIPAGAGGATILATVPARRYMVQESLQTAEGVANAQVGFLITDLTQAAAPTDEVPAGGSFIMPPEPDASFHGEVGLPIANGPGVQIGVGPTAALPLCKVVSFTGAATAVIVWEMY